MAAVEALPEGTQRLVGPRGGDGEDALHYPVNPGGAVAECRSPRQKRAGNNPAGVGQNPDLGAGDIDHVVTLWRRTHAL
jgi:hypothetical protein